MSRGHFAVNFTAATIRPAPIHKTVSFRKLCSIDVETFKRDITDSTILHLFSGSVHELANAYNNWLHSLINKRAPLYTKTLVLRHSYPWYSNQLHEAKHLWWKQERKWHWSQITKFIGTSVQPWISFYNKHVFVTTQIILNLVGMMRTIFIKYQNIWWIMVRGVLCQMWYLRKT